MVPLVVLEHFVCCLFISVPKNIFTPHMPDVSSLEIETHRLLCLIDEDVELAVLAGWLYTQQCYSSSLSRCSCSPVKQQLFYVLRFVSNNLVYDKVSETPLTLSWAC